MKPIHVERLYQDLAAKVGAMSDDRRQALKQEMKRMSEGPLTKAIKKAINQSGQTPCGVARAAGIEPSSVYRFLEGGELKISSVDRLAEHLGLELKPTKKTRKVG